MIERSETFLKQLVFLIDLAVLVLAFLGTYIFRQSVSMFYHVDVFPGSDVLGPLKSLESYLWLLLVILPLWTGMLYAMILDENGRELAAANQAFQIDGKATMPVNGDGLIEGEQSGEVASWRIEYWVQTYPRPIR